MQQLFAFAGVSVAAAFWGRTCWTQRMWSEMWRAAARACTNRPPRVHLRHSLKRTDQVFILTKRGIILDVFLWTRASKSMTLLFVQTQLVSLGCVSVSILTPPTGLPTCCVGACLNNAAYPHWMSQKKISLKHIRNTIECTSRTGYKKSNVPAR